MGLKSADVVVRTNITVSNDAAIFRAWKKRVINYVMMMALVDNRDEFERF